MKPTISEMEKINPLIDSDGDTYRVSMALSALAQLFEKPDDGTKFDVNQSFGISILLETCAEALRRMAEVNA